MGSFKQAWSNAYYRATMIYIAVIVTLIFVLQLYRFFVSAPADEIKNCPPTRAQSAVVLIPVIGVFLDDGIIAQEDTS